MPILLKYLTEEEINYITNTFDENLISRINEKSLLKIITYLLENKVFYWKDIIIYYFDVCVLNDKEFIKKFEILKEKYSILEIGENLSLLENLL